MRVINEPRSFPLLSTIWYELHAREWPYKSQPAEAIIWQIGSGMKPNLSQTGMGKEISVSSLGLSPTSISQLGSLRAVCQEVEGSTKKIVIRQ